MYERSEEQLLFIKELRRSKKPRIERKCKQCKKIMLVVKKSERSFCSINCHNSYMKGKPNLKVRRRIIVNCETCGNPMEMINCNAKQGDYHFCKQSCHTEWRKVWTKNICKEKFQNDKNYQNRMKTLARNQWNDRSTQERKLFSEKISIGLKKYFKINPRPMKFCSRFGCNNKHKAKGLCLKHYMEIWNKNNPHSSGGNFELRLAIDSVKKRDKNTCQWQGCGLTFEQTTIDVHHIFPRKEYPELELIQRYMICYCVAHHYFWHKMKGDHYYHLIKERIGIAMDKPLKLQKQCRLLVTPSR